MLESNTDRELDLICVEPLGNDHDLKSVAISNQAFFIKVLKLGAVIGKI